MWVLLVTLKLLQLEQNEAGLKYEAHVHKNLGCLYFPPNSGRKMCLGKKFIKVLFIIFLLMQFCDLHENVYI